MDKSILENTKGMLNDHNYKLYYLDIKPSHKSITYEEALEKLKEDCNSCKIIVNPEKLNYDMKEIIEKVFNYDYLIEDSDKNKIEGEKRKEILQKYIIEMNNAIVKLNYIRERYMWIFPISLETKNKFEINPSAKSIYILFLLLNDVHNNISKKIKDTIPIFIGELKKNISDLMDVFILFFSSEESMNLFPNNREYLIKLQKLNRNFFYSENKENEIKIIDKSDTSTKQFSLENKKVNDYLLRKYLFEEFDDEEESRSSSKVWNYIYGKQPNLDVMSDTSKIEIYSDDIPLLNKKKTIEEILEINSFSGKNFYSKDYLKIKTSNKNNIQDIFSYNLTDKGNQPFWDPEKNQDLQDEEIEILFEIKRIEYNKLYFQFQKIINNIIKRETFMISIYNIPFEFESWIYEFENSENTKKFIQQNSKEIKDNIDKIKVLIPKYKDILKKIYFWGLLSETERENIFNKGEKEINDYIELIDNEKRKLEIQDKFSKLIDFYTGNNYSKIKIKEDIPQRTSKKGNETIEIPTLISSDSINTPDSKKTEGVVIPTLISPDSVKEGLEVDSVGTHSRQRKKTNKNSVNQIRAENKKNTVKKIRN